MKRSLEVSGLVTTVAFCMHTGDGIGWKAVEGVREVKEILV